MRASPWGRAKHRCGKTFKGPWKIKKGPDPKCFCMLVKSFRPPFRPQKKKKLIHAQTWLKLQLQFLYSKKLERLLVAKSGNKYHF